MAANTVSGCNYEYLEGEDAKEAAQATLEILFKTYPDLMGDKIPGAEIYEPGPGCEKCNKGFKGRIALYEVMVFGEELKSAVLQGYSTAELKAEAIRLGMQSLRMAGINKVLEGVTSIPEVLRVTAPD